MFSSGTNPIMLLRNLAALGTVSVCHLHAEHLPPLEQLDPSQCYLSWTVELASSCPEEELLEVFEFVVHLAETPHARPVYETMVALVRHYLEDAGVQVLPEDVAGGPIRTLRFRPSMGWVHTRA